MGNVGGHVATKLRRKTPRVGKPTRLIAAVRGLHGVRLVRHQGKSALELRDRLNLTQAEFGRLVDVSVRTIAKIESDGKKADSLLRDYLELKRLCDALGEVVDSAALGEWFYAPNKQFGGSKPVEVIERGEIDRLWELVYRLRSGMPG
jgi:DNA-binding XRE family transcriptional regulator